MKFLVLALCVVAAMADPHWVMLDNNEADLVRDSWDHVKNHEIDILYNIFKDNQDIQNKFTQFNGKNLDQLKGTADFAVHATRIVSFMSTIIEFLGHDDAMPALKTLMNDMGHNHKDRNVSKDQFNEFRTSLVNYMKTHGTWGDNVQNAWNKALDKMWFVIFQNLDGKTVN